MATDPLDLDEYASRLPQPGTPAPLPESDDEEDEVDDIATAGPPEFDEVDYNLEEELERRRKDGSLIKLKARMIMESEGLPSLHGMLSDREVKPADRLQAMKLLASLGDLEPRGIAVNTGGPAMVIQFNIPTPGKPAPITDVIETTAEPVVTETPAPVAAPAPPARETYEDWE